MIQHPIPNVVEQVYAYYRDGILKVKPGGHFDAHMVTYHTSVQLLNIAQKLTAIAEGHVVGNERGHVATVANLVRNLGKELAEGMHYGAVLRADREQALDADVRTLVTSAASIMYQTPAFMLAITEHLNHLGDKTGDIAQFADLPKE